MRRKVTLKMLLRMHSRPFITYVFASLLQGDAVLTHDHAKHDHGDELRGVRLGGGDADLGPSVDVHTAVRLSANGAADCVGDADDQRAPVLAVAKRHQGVGRLARLRDEEAHVVPEDGRVSVEEVRCQLHHHGQLGQLLEKLSKEQTIVCY
jgi:hypothetical protein